MKAIIDYKLKTSFFLLMIFLLIFFVSCGEKKTNNPKKLEITESSVIGLYSGKYAGWNSTIKLFYGGSFILKSPFLSNGSKFGDWAIKGNFIHFFENGMQTFSAQIIDNGLIFPGQTIWKKIR